MGDKHTLAGDLTPEAFAQFAKTQQDALANLGQTTDDLKEWIARVEKQIPEENAHEKYEQLRGDTEGRFAEIGEQLADNKKLIEDLDQAMARAKATMGQPTEPERKLANAFAQELATCGEIDKYRERAAKDNKVAHRFMLKNMLPIRRSHGFAGESSVVIDSDLVGDGSDPYVRQGLTELIRDPIGLIDVVNEVPGVSDVDIYKEMVEDEEGNMAFVAAAHSGAETGSPAVDHFDVTNTEGFYIGQSVYIFTTAGGKQGPHTIDSITAGSKLNFASAVVDYAIADGDLIVSESFVATAENAVKPAGALKATLQSATIDTLATYLILTRQRLRRTNIFDLSAWAARTLPMRLRESLEYFLLWGSGTSPQYPGFLNATQLSAFGVSTDTWSTDMESGDNRADTILWSAANIPGDRPKVAVFHKLDWYRLTAAKNLNGDYVHGMGEGPRIIDTPMLKAIGGVRVVTSSKITQNYALVMDPMQASSFVRIPDAEMTMGYVNDQFISNQQTLLYEQSFAHLLKVGTAWRRVYLDAPPT